MFNAELIIECLPALLQLPSRLARTYTCKQALLLGVAKCSLKAVC